MKCTTTLPSGDRAASYKPRTRYSSAWIMSTVRVFGMGVPFRQRTMPRTVRCRQHNPAIVIVTDAPLQERIAVDPMQALQCTEVMRLKPVIEDRDQTEFPWKTGRIAPEDQSTLWRFRSNE